MPKRPEAASQGRVERVPVDRGRRGLAAAAGEARADLAAQRFQRLREVVGALGLGSLVRLRSASSSCSFRLFLADVSGSAASGATR